ncbi:uncharacterized protein NEPG_00308 [Nematocida parisii ERTm1]|uniref:uncharacterized protein n=1 Tax=Nematocida parisii (strain ERTm1 / ATCC PRA-289) TaxID=881290 RepID=UPI000264B8D7|nr:uncharacterized protein NEPG_00308 [Nematocida parisii ERTm1]KAI5127799.1 hypothetical protein NEPAR08_1050 [Nematocida parisii]EIJ94784.1 hypothetical protein NEPG_00308 [Nematocida parisii ERTm1]KAI5128222.1 hypothetical protein NEPAR03_1230 [Nematocida parisii]KAI5142390.1 hypothetical protein NEPAR04_1509 [Nematocida parisii]KAI5145275.1 hypothetical protein NEPAR07_1583 [Nematocida parisii]|eukprot:XP_013058140.1 hypothetical protein NEPG_00308 [Nematocida parisii ERTm1]
MANHEAVNHEIITTLGDCPPSQAHLHRIPTDNMPFYCDLCEEVLLKKDIPSHVCSVPDKKPEPENTKFYDTHCGVADIDTGTDCTRSLNCKVHSVIMKRSITKRSLPYDVLVKRVIEERKKRKIEKDEVKLDKREKLEDPNNKLEDLICSKILSHVPVIEKTFYLPEIKFDTLAVRSLFFQPLKIYRMQNDRKYTKK